jgi:AraC-like DNA-binding protein
VIVVPEILLRSRDAVPFSEQQINYRSKSHGLCYLSSFAASIWEAFPMLGLLDPSVLETQISGERNRPELVTTDPRICRALELLRETRTVRVGQIASSLNLSESHFRHLFKQELGLSPTQYVKIVRLDQARELLTSSFLTIKEVAVQVGVNDISHFMRDYKALFGQTPSETRRLLRSNSCRKLRIAVSAIK